MNSSVAALLALREEGGKEGEYKCDDSSSPSMVAVQKGGGEGDPFVAVSHPPPPPLFVVAPSSSVVVVWLSPFFFSRDFLSARLFAPLEIVAQTRPFPPRIKKMFSF